jgi:SAM-dependent methyltransferase
LGEFPSLTGLADIGCGSGIYEAEFKRRGLRVAGCEYSRNSRRAAKRRGIDVHPFDLSQSSELLPGCPYPAAMTVEVAEHIPSSLADQFVTYVAGVSNLIIFTAAQPGQGGHGHINEQPRSYWSEKFLRVGFEVDAHATARVAGALRSSDAFPILYNNLQILRRC